MMESDAADGMMRRYAAVRLGTIRHHPCTMEFVKGEDDEEDYFIVIDGRHETITINTARLTHYNVTLVWLSILICAAKQKQYDRE